MFRPSLRSSVTTLAAAVVLVGGASLASYAATNHGHGAGAAATTPKTIKFHLGAPGKSYSTANPVHLFTAKVPKGTYEVGLSGLLLDQSAGATDNYTCLLSDKRTILKLLGSPGPNPDFSRVYAIDGASQSEGTYVFGLVDSTNPVAKVDRPNIVYGCILSGTGPYVVGRTPTFTLTPVKVTAKSGTPLPVAKSQAHRLLGTLR
jgi:hypothetical protein